MTLSPLKENIARKEIPELFATDIPKKPPPRRRRPNILKKKTDENISNSSQGTFLPDLPTPSENASTAHNDTTVTAIEETETVINPPAAVKKPQKGPGVKSSSKKQPAKPSTSTQVEDTAKPSRSTQVEDTAKPSTSTQVEDTPTYHNVSNEVVVEDELHRPDFDQCQIIQGLLFFTKSHSLALLLHTHFQSIYRDIELFFSNRNIVCSA